MDCGHFVGAGREVVETQKRSLALSWRGGKLAKKTPKMSRMGPIRQGTVIEWGCGVQEGFDKTVRGGCSEEVMLEQRPE